LDAYREAFSACLGIIIGNLYYCNNNLQVAEAAEGEERCENSQWDTLKAQVEEKRYYFH
jgi:hypothetical protein